MLDLVFTVFGISCIIIGMMLCTAVIVNWFAEQDHRRCLEASKSMREDLRQDKDDDDE